MGVGVDEPRDHGAPMEVDHAGVGSSKAAYVDAGAHRRDAIAGEGDRLLDAEGRIERNYASAKENQVGSGHE